jgi:N-acylneuraminate cytidylyltransferase
MNIAVIPARGGSRRIRNKNVRQFCGQPMLAWSIQAAAQSQLFEQIIVSTDCPRIAATARQYGASVPFTRPACLADDHTPTIPVVQHAIEWLGQNGQPPELVCCLYATAPFVQPDDLRRGLQLLKTGPDTEFAFSVTRFSFPIQRALKIKDDRVSMFQPEHELTRSQDLEEAWHDAGQFYWGTTDAFLRHNGFYSARSAPVVIPAHRVQDIDTEDDWTRAEWMFRAMARRSGVA